METATMGRVLTQATIENVNDLWNAEQGIITPDKIRRVTVDDALIDTGATMLSLPTRLIHQLGLKKMFTRRFRTSTGAAEATVYGTARLTIQDRACDLDVCEVPDDVPVLVGQIPLENLDFVVDLKSQRLIGNPAHGGEWVLDMY